MKHLFLTIALIFSIGPASTLFADVINPEEEACSGKEAGAACTSGGVDGTCQSDTCSRLDYSNGTPTESVEYDCLLCKEGTPSEDTGTSEETSPTPTNDKGDDSSCSVGGLAQNGLPLWSLLAGAGLAGALIVMRKRS